MKYKATDNFILGGKTIYVGDDVEFTNIQDERYAVATGKVVVKEEPQEQPTKSIVDQIKTQHPKRTVKRG